MQIRNYLRLLVAAACSLHIAAQASPDFPNRPIKLIVAAPAGGGTDVMARALGEKLSVRLNQSVIVENKPGGNGFIGINAVAQAKPDGYTLLATTTGFNVGPLLYKSFTVDPVRDLTPVVEVMTVPVYLVTNAAAPFKTLHELVAYAKANPGKINMGGFAAGQMDVTLLLSSLAIDVNYVPYPGSAPLTQALVSDNVQLVMATLPAIRGLLADGRVRALAALSQKRSPILPEVPSVLEAYPQAQIITASNGISGPKGMPPDVVRKLNAEFNAVLQDRELAARFANGLAAEVRGGTPEGWLSVQDHGLQQYRRAAQALKIQPQ